MKKNKKLPLHVYFAGAIFVLALIGGTLFFTSSKKVFFAEKNSAKIDSTGKINCVNRRLIDGICLEESEDENPSLIAVMIENHPASRPQAGLAQASVVYEALVEGSFTRFMAIFPQSEVIDKTGPVRSARPYYLDWLREWGNPRYMHVGGSPEALRRIAAGGIFDANEFFNGNSFWRDTARRAPHNTYTNTQKWDAFFDAYPEFMLSYTPWNFVTSTMPCAMECVTKIRILDFNTSWDYVTSTGRYVRYHGNNKHLVEEGEIFADTIVIQEVKTRVIDNEGRLSLQTIGQGPAAVVYEGKMIAGTWKKELIADRTRFYDMSGVEILFKPGKIWIEVVPKIANVIYES